MAYIPIPGYPKYEVSDSGEVVNVRTGRVLVQPLDSHGYAKVNLYSGPRERQTRYVHRLVAEAFLGPCPPGQVVRHLNDVKSDNAVGNLAYGTYADNAGDAVRNGRAAHGVIGDWQSAKTHCPRGHEYTEANTYISRSGWRNCRACHRIRRLPKQT